MRRARRAEMKRFTIWIRFRAESVDTLTIFYHFCTYHNQALPSGINRFRNRAAERPQFSTPILRFVCPSLEPLNPILLISTQFHPTIYIVITMNQRVYLVAALLLTLASSVQAFSLNAKPSANPNCIVPFCTTCAVAATCDVCDPSYYLQANTCSSCAAAIVGCVTCDFNAVSLQVECSVCDTAYTLTAPTTCSLCSGLVPNCATCTFVTPTTTCNSCASGYYLLTNVCSTCASAVPNCATCSYNSVSLQAECSACAATYVLTTPTTCALCSSFVPNCISCTYAAPTATCNACAPGFYLSPTQTCMPCTTNFANCALCTDSAVSPF